MVWGFRDPKRLAEAHLRTTAEKTSSSSACIQLFAFSFYQTLWNLISFHRQFKGFRINFNIPVCMQPAQFLFAFIEVQESKHSYAAQYDGRPHWRMILAGNTCSQILCQLGGRVMEFKKKRKTYLPCIVICFMMYCEFITYFSTATYRHYFFWWSAECSKFQIHGSSENVCLRPLFCTFYFNCDLSSYSRLYCFSCQCVQLHCWRVSVASSILFLS